MTGKLPIWMDGTNAQAFKSLMEQWWEKVGLWTRLPTTTFDVLTCSVEFVDLLAFQRSITRYSGESESFYRLRVHHAWRNIKSAGTPRGMNEVFNNLDLPQAEYFERMPGQDWDVTKVVFEGRGFAANPEEIAFTLKYYWRTCRRYSPVHKVVSRTAVGAALLGNNRNCSVKRTQTTAVSIRPSTSRIAAAVFGNNRNSSVNRTTTKAVSFRPLLSGVSIASFFNTRVASVRTFSL